MNAGKAGGQAENSGIFALLSSGSTFRGTEFAWGSMARAALSSMLCLVYSVISLAMSMSRMRLSAFFRFSAAYILPELTASLLPSSAGRRTIFACK